MPSRGSEVRQLRQELPHRGLLLFHPVRQELLQRLRPPRADWQPLRGDLPLLQADLPPLQHPVVHRHLGRRDNRLLRVHHRLLRGRRRSE